MSTCFIQVPSVERLRKLVDIVNRYPCDVNLRNDLGCVDCKSLLGVLQMGISKNMKLDIIGEETEVRALVQNLSEDFTIDMKEGK